MEKLSRIQKEKLKEKYGEDFEKFIGRSIANLVSTEFVQPVSIVKQMVQFLVMRQI